MSDASTKLVRINAEVHRHLKVVAAQRGVTEQQLLERAVLDWCKRQPEVRRAQASAR